MNSLRSFYYYLTKPSVRDFISMGLGIEARYNRCKDSWNKHLELCRSFQREVTCRGDSVALLGAGRLYDLDMEFLSENFKVIDLYDADISVLPYWKRARCRYSNKNELGSFLVDLTGSINKWSKSLFDFLKREPSRNVVMLGDFLGNLRPEASPFGGKRYDQVWSVNILSQLSIYWRERVFTAVEKYWGVKSNSNGEYDAALQRGLELSMQALQKQHLDLLEQSKAKNLIILTDLYFYYYQREYAEWQVEKSLYFDLENYLSSRYRIVKKSSWFWHIAPQGFEHDEYGAIHEVHAWGLKR